MITLELPDNCYNPTGCFRVCFTGDNAQLEAGSLSVVEIGSADLSLIEVGSTMTINGTEFTFVNGPSQGKQIEFSANINTLSTNIREALIGNLDMGKQYSIFQSTAGGDLRITPDKASLSTAVTFSGLSGPSRTLNFPADPVTPQPGYGLYICFSEGGKVIAEQFIPAILELSEDETQIISAGNCMNIGHIFKFSGQIPSDTILHTSAHTKELDVIYSETSLKGSSSKQYAGPIRIIDGDNCSRELECNAPIGISIGEEICVGCKQPYWIRWLLEMGAEYSIELVVYRGGSIIDQRIVYQGNTQDSLIYIPVGPDQLGITEASRYIIRVSILDDNGSRTGGSINFRIKNTDHVNIIYKDRMGLYQGVALTPPISDQYTTTMEWVELCRDCRKEFRAMSKDQYRVVTFGQLCELSSDFFYSDEVYWQIGEDLFPMRSEGQLTYRLYPC